MSILEVWEQYRKQRDGDYFTENVSFVFVATATGARGYDAVRQFLATAYDSRMLRVIDRVLIRTVGENSIVEESETTINFINGDGVWLVPGIDGRYTIDSQVVIPTVTSAVFEGDRISSIRVYWDQASVLKQLKLISDKNSSWPIVSDRQIDVVRDIAGAHLNPFGRADRMAAGVGRTNLNNQQEAVSSRRQFHTHQSGGGSGGSSVFGDNDSYDDNSQRARFNSNKNASHFSIGDAENNNNNNNVQNDAPIAGSVNIDQQQYGRRPVHTSSRVNQPGGTGGKSSVFGDSDSYDENAQNRRFNSNKNASHFSIGDGSNAQPHDSSISGSSKRRGKSQFESSVGFGDDNQQRPSVKPSSRVLKPPGGGGSQITFG
ncbi:12096_t:CDS:2 [Funneliformis geosporum]|uniref:3654_t:CDS:1 n=1 Tax=Funneliformis geosporum TaxID=1117311 RepID=A0A9W4SNJ3_9GLOM|nr:12096_t:CDS:2 [Funneliformis geosporum]CAI2176742.1 3654_t:CDS:2 [Funneliformis geosporum]